jgi:hypothetical protein
MACPDEAIGEVGALPLLPPQAARIATATTTEFRMRGVSFTRTAEQVKIAG